MKNSVPFLDPYLKKQRMFQIGLLIFSFFKMPPGVCYPIQSRTLNFLNCEWVPGFVRQS